jgi:hypothetical protein
MTKTYKIIITLFFTIYQSFAFAQIKLSGTIINNATLQPIEYANIGLLEKGVGTVCNSLGKFNLVVPSDLLNNLLVISSLGYETATLKISDLKNNLTELKIELKPSAILLQEITVMASQQVSLGYKPNGNQVTGFFKATGLGLEGGTLIQNTGQVKLTQFNLNILKIPFDSLKFRVNIYSVKKDKPKTKLNTKDIVFTISKADTGLYSLPLVNQNIRVIDNFICTIELIELYGQPAENAEFLFSAIPNKDGIIYKKTISFGSWERIKKYSLCFWLTGDK